MGIHDFFLVLLKGKWIDVAKKHTELAGMMAGVVEAEPALYIENRIKLVMVPVLGPTCSSDDQESIWGIGLDVFSDIQIPLNAFGHIKS